MEFKDVKVGDKIINRENPIGIYVVSSKSHDLISVANLKSYKDCFHLTKRSIQKYDLVTEEKRKIVIKEGEVLNLNNEVVTITEVMQNIGFYYKNETDEVNFCNTMFETLNFEPVYE